jgi:stage III sporulation protein AG
LKERINSGLMEIVKKKERLLFQNIPVTDKNKILTAVMLVCIGVGFMLWGGVTEKKRVKTSPELPAKAVTLLESAEDRWSEARLERELAAVLTQIKGAGRVMVDIHLAGTEETQWLFRENKEERVVPQEKGGETREIKVLQEPVFQRKSGGEETPVSTGKKAPPITGVLVVAEGGDDPKIQKELWEATSVLLGIALYRVKVLPWGK